MKFTLNLASRRFVNNRALNHGFVAALCLLLIFGGWAVKTMIIDNATMQQDQLRLSEVEQQLQLLRGGPEKPLTVAERQVLEEEFAVVKSLQERDAFRWTELLDRMEKLLPKGVNLGGFKPDYKKKSLALTGSARSIKEMRVFLDRLLKNENFEQVYLNSHSRIKVMDYADKEREAIAFSIQLEGVF